MDEAKDPPRQVKVVDRRKFTPEGEPRQGAAPAVESRPAEEVGTASSAGAAADERQQPPGTSPPTPDETARDAGPAPPPAEERRQPAGGGSPSQLFLELVAMLAQNAEILMVGAEGIPARPQEARRMIDWLAALEEKTAGNLSADEAQVVTDLLFQLRSLYVQSQR